MTREEHRGQELYLSKKCKEVEDYIGFLENKIKAAYQLLVAQNPSASQYDLIKTAHDRVGYDKVTKAKKDLEQLKSKQRYHFLMALEKKYMNEYLWSDVNPYEVIEERTEKCFVIRAMKATLTEKAKTDLQESFVPGGFCGHFDNSLQAWTYESDPDGVTLVVRKWKDGCWHQPGSPIKFRLSDAPLKVYDYNF